MKKRTTLQELLRNGEIKELDIIDPNSLFSVVRRKVLMLAKQTGRRNDYYVRRHNMNYILFKNEGIPILVGVPTNENRIFFVGEKGFYNASNVLKDLSEIYSNEKYGISCMPLSSVTAQTLIENEEFKGFPVSVWINQTIIGRIPDKESKEMLSIKEKRVVYKLLHCKTSLGSSKYRQASNFAPELFIKNPEEIIVKKKGEVWKLYPDRWNWLLKFFYR